MREHKWHDVFRDTYYKIEFYFAKKWLNRTFGEKEYWGDWIASRISEKEANKYQ